MINSECTHHTIEKLGLLSEDDKDPGKPAATGTEYVRVKVISLRLKNIGYLHEYWPYN
jgi:hypothetical protein